MKTNYQRIETTSGMNGYPRNLKNATVGFDTFEEAQEYAQQYGGYIMSFHRRDGWQLWERGNGVCEPYTITEDDYGTGHELLEYGSIDEENFCDLYIKQALEGVDDVQSISEIVKDAAEIWDYYKNLDEGEAVHIQEGRYCDTIETKTMSWSYDTHNYIIGVLDDDTQDTDDEND